MKFIKYIYLTIKNSEWHMGYTNYKNKPKLGLFHDYYDGNNIAFHFLKFWISVRY